MSEVTSIIRSALALCKDIPGNLNPKNYEADIYIDTLADLDLKKLTRKSITTVFIDMDNTITACFGEYVDPKIAKKLESLCKQFKVYLFSNGDEERVQQFLKRNKKFLLNYHAPHGKKKPDPKAYHELMKKAKVKPKECAMIGDRYMSDVVGARKAGCGLVIKTKPLRPESEPYVVRAVRVVESSYARMHGK